MLIERYDLEVFTPPCSPGDERFSAIAHLPVDIRAALPYLNATLRGAAYSQVAQALSWRKAGQCGQPTCWNFALKLAAALVELAQCPPLFEPAFAERLAQLQGLAVPMPAIGRRMDRRVPLAAREAWRISVKTHASACFGAV